MAYGDPPRCGYCGAYKTPLSSGVGSLCPNRCEFNMPRSEQKMSETLWTPDKKGFDTEKAEQAAKLLLEAMGEDVSRDGLKDTPKRFAEYYSEIMNGNFQKPEDNVTEFDNDGDYDGAVVLKDIPFYTICEHHLAPFIGTWDVAYKPGERIIGLSKLVRIARVFQKRPQVQERLTKQIADAIHRILEPEWTVVRMQAEHFCMSTRGVRTPGALTETMTGVGDYPKDVFTSV